MPTSPSDTLQRFYTAFSQLDHATMAECYAPEAEFDDEAFSLRGRDQVAGMWRMLCSATRKSGAAHWKLEFRDLHADGLQGRAHWEAHYTFSATGRRVHNIIDAEFTFNEAGLILRHRDRFSFWRWSRQALGLPGLLLGWSPSLKRQVRSTAANNLRKFLALPPA
ncbi:nuclear transport factor 2 family protein [Curvibacter sp. HBC61]|uniref:Nuclear transport factor 2 family protein n=1 Tax=Curvibacter cyanobacteriorum TaxID=3026422 RepID=A0ABT5N3K0_9BURK|nr:nuclear transport factor 2 family protein [Curvibacter sp. HBC61]MDD0840613.1 nuclear transport factor 2 family protein [Curvibacter sp. HBC61]